MVAKRSARATSSIAVDIGGRDHAALAVGQVAGRAGGRQHAAAAIPKVEGRARRGADAEVGHEAADDDLGDAELFQLGVQCAIGECVGHHLRDHRLVGNGCDLGRDGEEPRVRPEQAVALPQVLDVDDRPAARAVASSSAPTSSAAPTPVSGRRPVTYSNWASIMTTAESARRCGRFGAPAMSSRVLGPDIARCSSRDWHSWPVHTGPRRPDAHSAPARSGQGHAAACGRPIRNPAEPPPWPFDLAAIASASPPKDETALAVVRSGFVL